MAKGVNKIRDLQFWYPNIPRKLVMAKGISIQAKFVYMYMSCQSATFEFLHEPMAKEMNIGTRTLSKYLNELIDSGWITNGGQKFKNGRKGAVDYIVETSPKNRNTDVQKTACSNTDVSKCDNKYINSSINTPLNNNNSIISNPVIDKERKRLSNDNQKAPDELFLKFWEIYGYKKGRDKAVKAWNRLNKKEKESAIKCIPVYKEDCLKHDRNMKYPSTYLNGKTWEDDFDCDGKVSDGEGFADLPAGLTPEKWEQASNWFKTRVPRIAGSITPNDHLSMMALARWKRDVYIEILIKIEASDYTGSILEEFERISETEEYSQRLWGNE